jgi:aromatic ring-cleaving dioxygenase
VNDYIQGSICAASFLTTLKQNKMALDRKTPFNVSFYDHEEQKIQNWAFKGSSRLALLVHTITSQKDKIEVNNINKEEIIKSALDYIIHDLKKFLETPYTTEDNV